MAGKRAQASEEEAPHRVKVTFYIEEEEDYIIEGIVREKKRTDRSFSKAEYFRQLMKNDPSFVSATTAARKKR